jgi:hypothetical protein
MLQRTLPAEFIAPCLPTKTDKLPSGSQWLHEIKHDGFRVIDSRPGNDLTHRFLCLRTRSCIIDQVTFAKQFCGSSVANRTDNKSLAAALIERLDSGCRARKDPRFASACGRFCKRNHRQATHRTCQGRRAQSRSVMPARNRAIARAFVWGLSGRSYKRPDPPSPTTGRDLTQRTDLSASCPTRLLQKNSTACGPGQA